MNRPKKIFAWVAFLFFLLLAYVVYDISTRTTFPGSHKPSEETSAGDSVNADSMP